MSIDLAYKKGFDKGFYDGLNDKAKKAISNFREFIQEVFHTSKYDNEFFKGYNDGYYEGIKEKNTRK